jgi:hypothetical protein
MRMISGESNDSAMADGVHDDSIANGYAATPGGFVAATWATLRRSWLLVLALLVALALASSARAEPTVSLGTANSFAVLAATTVTNTGPTVINGDLGVSPGSAVTNFPPGIVNGTIHAADGVALQAQSDLTTAYNDAAGRSCNVDLTGQDLGAMTLTTGVYCFSTSAQLTGTLTLNAQGNPNAVFIFQIGTTLVTASASTVSLINRAQSCRVFWQVGSSTTLGTTTTFRGNVLALTSNGADTGATVDGRLLARNAAVTLDSNRVTRAACDATGPTVVIGGGPGDGVPGNPVAPGTTYCMADDFKLRIWSSDRSGIRRVDVFLDGRLIKRSTQARFDVWIRAAGLLPGRHTIRVVSRDRAGNVTVARRVFTRCGRGVLPFFTGRSLSAR